MALVVKDRVLETTTTTGTGTLTLGGAVAGYQTFSSAIGNTNTTYYAIVGGSQWEVGLGTVGSGTLTRDTVLESSNSGNFVDFSAGAKQVFCTYPAERAVLTDAIGVTVQAYDAQLADIAALTPTDNTFIVGNGTNFVSEDAATARTSLGLGTLATQGDGDKGDITVSTSGTVWTINSEITEKLIPSGAIQFFARNTAPTGWLKANGALVSRTTYADLFTAIGTTFGAGDGSTTFALPDLRGEFLRGWDDGRGIDSGRVFGSLQLDQMQRITGGNLGIWNIGAVSSTGALVTVDGANSRPSSGAAETSATLSFDSAMSPNARVSSTTSGETRPRNLALLACIKF